MQQINTIPAGLSYIIQGAGWLTHPGMKRFVLIPILANVVVFLILTATLIAYFSSFTEWINNGLSFVSWLTFLAEFLAAVISAIAIFTLLLVYGYSFTLITNIIAAPFYGMLAEKIEQTLDPEVVLPEESIGSMVKRTLQREMTKLWYFISRGLLIAIGLFMLSWIPPFNLLVPVIGLIWGAWVMTLQYVDYPADNHKLSFKELRNCVKTQKYSTLGLGGTIMLGSMIPIVNIFIMPIAVAAGTLYWHHELQPRATLNRSEKPAFS